MGAADHTQEQGDEMPGGAASDAAREVAADNARRVIDGSMSRARFLGLLTVGAGAVVGAAAAVPVGASVLGTLGVKQPDQRINVGPVSSFALGRFEKRVLRYTPKQHGNYLADRVAWIRRNHDDHVDSLTGERGGFTAIWNRCAHLGCPVQNDGTLFVCPCHGGVYDRDGAVKAGPPVRPLDRFSWHIVDDELVLDAPRSLHRGIGSDDDAWTYGPLLAPGEYSSGVGGLLFPWSGP